MFIYGLFSTKDNELRYVAQTRRKLEIRLKEHLDYALTFKSDTYKDRWIRKVYSEGYEVKIKVIENVTNQNIDDREIFWIEHFSKLTNTYTGKTNRRDYYLSYEESKKWLKENKPNINSQNDYYKFAKMKDFPTNLPKSPQDYYGDKGVNFSWGYFLSNGRIQDNKMADKYLTYKECKRLLKPLKLVSKKEYLLFSQDKEFLCNRPERFYKNRGWISWGDYLGYKKPYPITEDLLIRYLNMFFKNINSLYKFINYSHKMCSVLPKKYKTFNKMFPNFDWNKINKHMINDYNEARNLVLKNNIRTRHEYIEFVKKEYHNILPIRPELKYQNNGWKNWANFLKNRQIKHRCDVPISLFRRYMKLFFPEIKDINTYMKFYRKNKENLSYRLPSRPDIVYKMSFEEIFNKQKDYIL